MGLDHIAKCVGAAVVLTAAISGSRAQVVLPPIDVLNTVTPSPHHPLGVKGIGEAGTIASTCTIYNAVLDALSPLEVDAVRMPLTPERVWRAIHAGHGT